MKVFVAGATGVVGRPAVAGLVAAGHSVTAVARSAAKAALLREAGAAPVEVDLFSASAVAAAVDGHEVVVNLATHIPPVSRSARKTAWATNDRLRVEASAHLVDGALAAGAERVVQESICFPYLDGGDDWIDEDHPVDHSFHGFVGAGAAEANVARFTAAGGVGVVLRFGVFYEAESIHTVAMNRLVRRRVSPFIGAPGSFTSPLHADDAGSAVVAALTAPAGTYNVVDDEPVRSVDADRIVADRLGVKPPHRIPTRLATVSVSGRAMAASQRVSHVRFTEATGWTPSVPSIREGWPA